MAYEQKPNTGSLFKNDRKESDTHPDYKGSALIDGLGDCWLDAWINTAKDGSKYMSLKIKPKEPRNVYASPHMTVASGAQGAGLQTQTGTVGGGGTTQPRPQPASAFDDDSEVPF